MDCTCCANCCRYSVVSVNKLEIENIASYLGATPEAVTRAYTVPDPEAPASRILRNSPEGCVFLDSNLCGIYGARPKTCREFPYVAVGTHALGGRLSSLARCPIIYNALERYKHLTGYHHSFGISGDKHLLRLAGEPGRHAAALSATGPSGSVTGTVTDPT